MHNSGSFQVGDWLVEPDLDRISRGDEQRTLRPRVMELLVYLAKQEGQMARSDALMNDLWRNRVVTDATLYNCIAELRHQLDGGSDGPGSIQTIPKKGYRLLLPVSTLDAVGAQDSPETRGNETRPAIRRAAFTVAAILAAGVAYLLADNFINEVDPSGDPQINASIAVLPFIALTSDPEDEYFADGLTEELVNTLSQLPDLKVSGRTSSFYYKDKTPNLRDVGKALGVAHVLEGSVRRYGNRLRVTADLVKADDGFHLWSDVYDRSRDDILAIQEDIARQVAASLKLTLLGAGDAAYGQHGTTNAEAQTRFLIASGRVRRGLTPWRDAAIGNEHLKVARRLLEEAVELDPDFGEAWAMLAYAYWLLPGGGLPDGSGEMLTTAEASALAGPAAERAIALAPDLPEAWAVMGHHLGHTMFLVNEVNDDLPGLKRETEAAFERALRLGPENLLVLETYADYRDHLGEYAAVLPLLDRAIALDPLSYLRRLRARVLYHTGQIDQARREYFEVARLYPDAPYQGGIAEIEFDRGHFHHGLIWLSGIEGALYTPYAWRSLGDTERALLAFSIYKGRGGPIAEFAALGEYFFLRDYHGLHEAAASATHYRRRFTLHSLYYLRRWQDAISMVEIEPQETVEDFTNATNAAYYAHALASVGRREDAEPLWRRALELGGREPLTTPRRIQERHHLRLLVFASRGEKQAALSELEAMANAGWRWLMSPGGMDSTIYSAGYGWFEDSPLLDSIRGEPRFVAALEKVKADNAAMLAALNAGLKLEDIMDEDVEWHVLR